MTQDSAFPDPLRPNTPVWNDEPWAALPSLQGDVHADVCVV